MILIDTAIGSKELAPLFRPYDEPVELCKLDSGDACWDGKGPGGEGVLIGLERKRITHDLIDSMRKRRLAGFQLPNMLKNGHLSMPYFRIYLLVEGIYKPDERGLLVEWAGGGWRPVGHGKPILFREVDAHLATLEVMYGGLLIVRRSSSKEETAAQIVSLAKWWAKGWDQHHSHLGIYAPAPQQLLGAKAQFVTPEDSIRQRFGEEGVYCWKAAAQLPGIDRKAEKVVEHFGTSRRMNNAGPREWQKIAGVGEVIAEQCVRLIGGKR